MESETWSASGYGLKGEPSDFFMDSKIKRKFPNVLGWQKDGVSPTEVSKAVWSRLESSYSG